MSRPATAWANRPSLQAQEAIRSKQQEQLRSYYRQVPQSLAFIIPLPIMSSGRFRQRHTGDYRLPHERAGNSQMQELSRCINGYPENRTGDFRRLQTEGMKDREEIQRTPTFYELCRLKRHPYSERIASRKDLRFLVLDELHTTEAQGADVAMLVRVQEAFSAEFAVY